MAEYDLVCDACHERLELDDGVISWTTREGAESGFALTHAAHAPAGATDRFEARQAAAPNGFLRFVSARLGARIAEPEPLRAVLWGLAPFVMRPDSAVEMDTMRAASFGQRVGVKPGTEPVPTVPAEQHDAGK